MLPLINHRLNPRNNMPPKPLEDGQIIIWLDGKDITTKDGKELHIIEGKLVLEGKEWDISVFENTSAKGTRYLKGKVKEPWQGNKEPLRGDDGSVVPF